MQIFAGTTGYGYIENYFKWLLYQSKHQLAMNRNYKAFDKVKKDCINNPNLLALVFKQLGIIYPNLESNFGTNTGNNLLAAEGIASILFLILQYYKPILTY